MEIRISFILACTLSAIICLVAPIALLVGVRLKTHRGLLAGLTCGIGLLWLNPYMLMANAAFYRSVAPSVYFRQQPNGGGYQNPGNDNPRPDSDYQQPGSDWYHPSDHDYRGPEL